MIFLSRLIAASAYAGAAFLFGMLLGERGELGVVQHLFAAVIPAATLVLVIVSRGARVPVFATGLAMLAGLLLGQQNFDRAWNDCDRRAADVRRALIAHEAQHGGYPSRLEELSIELPCSTTFRRTILHYLSNDRGFRLWYTNDRDVRNVGGGTAPGRRPLSRRDGGVPLSAPWSAGVSPAEQAASRRGWGDGAGTAPAQPPGRRRSTSSSGRFSGR